MNRFFKAFAIGAAFIALTGGLAACSGDDDGTPAAASSTVNGTVVKGPVSGSTVTFYAVDASGAKGASLGSTTTGAGGTYSATLAYEGAVLVEVTGGTYVDEATGASKTLADPMRVMVNASSAAAVSGVVTPLTTIAYSQAKGSGSVVTQAAFNTSLGNIATQFNLGTLNLATSVPSVSGTVNDYGRILRAVSQYAATNGAAAYTNFLAWTAPAGFSAAFTTAYSTANPGSTITVSFTNTGVTIGGTGAGGGTGTCGVNIKGTVTAQGYTVPLNMDFCISGIAAGSCTAGNSSISQGLGGNPALAGSANLQYTYTASCAAGATNITLQ